MKTLINTTLLAVVLSITGIVHADDDDDYGEYISPTYSYYSSNQISHNPSFTVQARVVDVKPIIEHVRLPARKHCWDEETSYRYPDSYRRESFPAHAVLGGIIGGAIGNQVGAGKGKDAATILGALTGIAIGHDAHQKAYKRPEPKMVTEHHCRVRDTYRTREKISGYQVTYRYHGHLFTTHMPYRPGNHISLAVSVNPVD